MTLPPRLMTPGEVAEIMHVDPKTVTRWASKADRDGTTRIRSIRTPGGHRRFFAADIEAWVRDGTMPPRGRPS